MMIVVLTGANGFLGEYLLYELLDHGHTVWAVYRDIVTNPEWSLPIHSYTANLITINPMAYTGLEAIYSMRPYLGKIGVEHIPGGKG